MSKFEHMSLLIHDCGDVYLVDNKGEKMYFHKNFSAIWYEPCDLQWQMVNDQFIMKSDKVVGWNTLKLEPKIALRMYKLGTLQCALPEKL